MRVTIQFEVFEVKGVMERCIVPLLVNEASTIEDAIKSFKDAICVFQNELAIKEDRKTIDGRRLDGRPSGAMLSLITELESKL